MLESKQTLTNFLDFGIDIPDYFMIFLNYKTRIILDESENSCCKLQ